MQALLRALACFGGDEASSPRTPASSAPPHQPGSSDVKGRCDGLPCPSSMPHGRAAPMELGKPHGADKHAFSASSSRGTHAETAAAVPMQQPATRPYGSGTTGAPASPHACEHSGQLQQQKQQGGRGGKRASPPSSSNSNSSGSAAHCHPWPLHHFPSHLACPPPAAASPAACASGGSSSNSPFATTSSPASVPSLHTPPATARSSLLGYPPFSGMSFHRRGSQAYSDADSFVTASSLLFASCSVTPAAAATAAAAPAAFGAQPVGPTWTGDRESPALPDQPAYPQQHRYSLACGPADPAAAAVVATLAVRDRHECAQPGAGTAAWAGCSAVAAAAAPAAAGPFAYTARAAGAGPGIAAYMHLQPMDDPDGKDDDEWASAGLGAGLGRPDSLLDSATFFFEAWDGHHQGGPALVTRRSSAGGGFDEGERYGSMISDTLLDYRRGAAAAPATAAVATATAAAATVATASAATADVPAAARQPQPSSAKGLLPGGRSSCDATGADPRAGRGCGFKGERCGCKAPSGRGEDVAVAEAPNRMSCPDAEIHVTLHPLAAAGGCKPGPFGANTRPPLPLVCMLAPAWAQACGCLSL